MILVTGGAGYIGSSIVSSLISKKYGVLVIDNLSKGKKEFVNKRAKFYDGDLMDKSFLDKVFSDNDITSIIHLAAYKSVEESMKDKNKYSDNVIGTINLLNSMCKFGVKRIIFSSSAAVYGAPKYIPIDEKHQLKPLNYYGFTKLECERIINSFSNLKGIIGINLRYFNVAGDTGLNYTDDDASDIFSILMRVLYGKLNKFIVFGNDYNTRDGTCIRDYISLNDLVNAHILSLKLNKSNTINLGTSKGVSVLELINSLESISGKKIRFEIGKRRKGDSPVSVASFNKAKRLLGWEPLNDIKSTIKSAITFPIK